MQAWTQWAVADQVPPDLYGELHPASVVLLVILALSAYRLRGSTRYGDRRR